MTKIKMRKCPCCGHEEPEKSYIECTGYCHKTIEITPELAEFLRMHGISFAIHNPNVETREYRLVEQEDC